MHYNPDNIFAKILAGKIPCHKVYEDDKTLAFMDVMPQAVGHVLEFAAAVIATAQKVIKAQRQVLKAKGIIQMQLNNQEAGQSVFHYHMHLIPTHIHQLGKHEDKLADMEQLAEIAAKLSQAIV